MSQFGMQMPGGQLQRGPSLNIYTGLLGLACLALFAACVFIGVFQGPQIGPNGSPFDTHKYNESTKTYDIKFSADPK